MKTSTVSGGLNRYYTGKVHLRGLVDFKPTEVGFASIAAVLTARLSIKLDFKNILLRLLLDVLVDF